MLTTVSDKIVFNKELDFTFAVVAGLNAILINMASQAAAQKPVPKYSPIQTQVPGISTHDALFGEPASDSISQKYNVPTANLAADAGLSQSSSFRSKLSFWQEREKANAAVDKPKPKLTQAKKSESVVTDTRPVTQKNNNASFWERALDVMVPAAHADELGAADNSKHATLDESLANKALIGSGRAFTNMGQGVKQLALKLGEKAGFVEEGRTQEYTDRINAEKALYDGTPVGQSTTAKVSEVTTDILTFLAVPGGAGARSARFIAGSAASGGIISGLSATQSTSLADNAKNAAVGTVVGGTSAYVVGKVVGRVRNELVPKFEKLRSKSSKVSSPKFRIQDTTQAPNTTYNASNVNAHSAISRKLSALEFAQRNAARVENLPDGRVRYYAAERPSNRMGTTRGASYVTEHNQASGQVRSWMECYDHYGKVNRIHPKMIDGQVVSSQHYPPIQSEFEAWLKKPGGPR